MARFYGEIGYGVSEENPAGSGVWVDNIVKRSYYGDVLRNTKRSEPAEQANANISVGNSISIVADEYATEHFFNIKYVQWEGAPWTVTSVTVQGVRLILEIGSVYNGPTE